MDLSRYRSLFKGLLFLLSLVGIGLLLHELGGSHLMDQAWIDSVVAGRGVRGELLFLGVGTLFTAVGLPRQLVAFLGGYAFGLLQGTLLALLATLFGALLCYLYAHWFGHRLLAPRLAGRARHFHDLLQDHPFSLTLLIRLLPVGSNVVTNLLAGLARAPLGWFLLGSSIGYLPQTLVFTLAGSGLDVDSGLRLALSVILFLLSGILGLYLYRHHRQRRELDEVLEKEPAPEPAP
ncbi:MAG: SNARE associated Golgi protein [Gammaproteobacteria bacterium]|nr:MAG: SNARE associated Golgi protein [Gammaproteobacteria bacterium]